MSDKKRTVLGMLAAVSANVIWGFGVVFARKALMLSSPAVLMFWRFLAAFAAMRIYAAVRRRKLSRNGRPWKALLIMGVFEPAMYFTCEQYGILFTSATFTSVVLAMGPVSTMVFGALFLREKPTVRQVVFSLISIAGVVALSVSPGSKAIARPLGILLLVGAVLAGSGYFTVNRRISGVYTPFERTYFMVVLGLGFFFLWALLENLGRPAGLTEPLGEPWVLAATLYQGVAATAVAYVLISYSATYLPTARTTVFSNLYTIVAVLAGILFLKEPFLPMLIPCTAMILVGVWGVQRYGRGTDELRTEKKHAPAIAP